MNAARGNGDVAAMPPDLGSVSRYLDSSGWVLDDTDERTSLWRPGPAMPPTEVQIALPVRPDVSDYPEWVSAAVRVLAYVEQRGDQDVLDDIGFGGADNVSVRLTPNAPAGEAPLPLAYAAVSALRSYVIGSAAGVETDQFVLPARRPQRAEAYSGQTRIGIRAGSFILTVALPLDEIFDEGRGNTSKPTQETLVDVPPQPFGRRVSDRMRAAVESSRVLADAVNSGDQPLSAFGRARAGAANATELAALSDIGGPDHELYQVRFAPSPLVRSHLEPIVLPVTPGQQRIFGEAAEFLRTKQPRPGVLVVGLVVRLARGRPSGTGDVVIQGVDDDSGVERRYRAELGEADYSEAVRAHWNGLMVAVRGDLQIRGTRLSLHQVASFAVLPGLDDDDF